MTYPQKLPHYTHNFLQFPNWIIKESEHYVFHYTKDSIAEKDIKKIKERKEKSFQKITTNLTLPTPPQKISYYFYPTPNLKKELMGDDWFAQSIYNEFCVHILYTEEVQPVGEHEDTHLLSLPWGISINFLQEGLAEYMVGKNWYGVDFTTCVREGLQKGYILNPELILTETDWINTPEDGAIYYYSLAGLWVKYLIESFGLEIFEKMYRNCQRNDTGDTIKTKYLENFGISLPEISRKFWQTLE